MTTKLMDQFHNQLGLLLPKGYLSYSQMDLWLKNPSQYKSQYFENGPRIKTRYTEFGKKIAEMIENGLHTQVLPNLIVFPEHEFKIETIVNGVPVLCYLDSYHPDTNEFRDDKTGMKPWTQGKVQSHEQLPFYACALKALTGNTPKKCYIDWLETREVKKTSGFSSPSLQLTGKVVPFERIFDEREIMRMEQKIQTVAIQISNAYKEFISTL